MVDADGYKRCTMGKKPRSGKRLAGVAREGETTDRRSIERRAKKSEGYTYIQIVGWIDRRERSRRASDTFAVLRS